MFSIYRVIKAPLKPKLSTITDGFTGNAAYITLMKEWMKSSIPILLPQRFNKRALGFAVLLPIEKSSPTNTKSWFGFLTDAIAIAYSPIFPAFRGYCELSNNTYILNKILGIVALFTNNRELLSFLPKKTSLWVKEPLTTETGLPIGQLAFKEEAAGKLRVFAIVDIYTQSLLKPLHDALFSLLKTLPNDGTFDQDLSFKRCMEKAHIAKVAFGYDLSAATDRLPIDLQIGILSNFIGIELAEA